MRLASLYGTRKAVARVTDALDFANFAQHLPHFHLRFITQVTIAHLFQKSSDGDFDFIGEIFFVFDLLVDLFDLVAIMLIEHITHKAEQLLHSLAIEGSLLLGLHHRDFGRLY